MNKLSLGKNALRYGLITGMLLIVYSLILYILDVDMQSGAQYASILILLIMSIVAVTNWRDKHNDGNLSYGQGLGTGTLVALYGGILAAIYTYIFLKFIDPGMIQDILDTTEQKMYEQNPDLTSEQAEMALSWTRKMMNPGAMAVMGAFGNVFWGFIMSLIYSIFLKKEAPVQFDEPVDEE